MAMAVISATPKAGEDIKKFRVLKERIRRKNETAAFHELRHTLEAVDAKAFWRMEKVDIADGADYLIQKMAGGSKVKTPERVPIVLEEKGPKGDEKYDRIAVEKHRRKRESDAIKKLKQTLLKYSETAHKKMERVDVLVMASEFLLSLKASKSSKVSSPSCYSTPISPANSVDSGIWSVAPSPLLASPELALLASLLLTPPFTPISPFLAFQKSTLPSTQRLSAPPAKKSRMECWRPWE